MDRVLMSRRMDYEPHLNHSANIHHQNVWILTSILLTQKNEGKTFVISKGEEIKRNECAQVEF